VNSAAEGLPSAEPIEFDIENREVLVNRQPRRLSRLLLAVLLVSFSTAALSFIYKMNHAGSAAPAGQTPAPLAPMVSDEPAPAAIPATQPSPQAAPPAWPPPSIEASGAVEAAVRLPSPATEPSVSPASLLERAQAKADAGRFLEARGELNDALQSPGLDPSQANSVKAMLGRINQTVVFGHRRFADDAYGGVYIVQSGDTLGKIANAHDCTWEFLSRINGIEPRHLRAGSSIKIIDGPFFAVVEKHKFTMDVYLGGLPGEKSAMFIASYPVGLGRDDCTPVGTWIVEPHHKLKHPTYYSPRGEGVIAADDPKNPLGGYWIGLTGSDGQAIGKISYGIHGTIEPESIGKQSSMGCIRMRPEDIAVVFDMMVEGKSLVVVKE
jgi:lipoprotein-anchoring transpeptidase ErfK/SrfK